MERDIQEVLLSEEQLRTRIAELGEELSRDYADKKPVIVGVLKGVVVFYADMIRQIKVPCEMDFMVISSYSGTETTGNVLVKKDVSVDLKGRHVLILEDIFDTGNSLDFVYNHLKAMEPASVKICTLLDKPERRKEGITLQADYVGFTIPNVFVVGYGLDFDEYYRNLPYVGIVKPEVYQK
jgi:hypoxanthine phosphoribosyltransferase